MVPKLILKFNAHSLCVQPSLKDLGSVSGQVDNLSSAGWGDNRLQVCGKISFVYLPLIVAQIRNASSCESSPVHFSGTSGLWAIIEFSSPRLG